MTAQVNHLRERHLASPPLPSETLTVPGYLIPKRSCQQIQLLHSALNSARILLKRNNLCWIDQPTWYRQAEHRGVLNTGNRTARRNGRCQVLRWTMQSPGRVSRGCGASTRGTNPNTVHPSAEPVDLESRAADAERPNIDVSGFPPGVVSLGTNRASQVATRESGFREQPRHPEPPSRNKQALPAMG